MPSARMPARAAWIVAWWFIENLLEWMVSRTARCRSLPIVARPPRKLRENGRYRQLQRLQLAEHRRDQLGDRGVDVDGVGDRRVRRAGVHHVDDAMDRLVGFDAQQGGADDLLRFAVDQHFHEALRLAA